jgi:hypothetical protein
MFARFHDSIRPKEIDAIFTLVNIGGHNVAFSAKLEDPVLQSKQFQSDSTK